MAYSFLISCSLLGIDIECETFDIVLGTENKENVNVEIYDVSGKVVYKGTKEGTAFNISVPDLSSGLYIVRLSSGEYNETLKFIKQ